MIFPAGIFPSGIFQSGIFPGTLTSTTSTPIYPAIIYPREFFMFQQYIDTNQSFPVQIKNSSNEVITTLVNPSIYVKVNGGSRITTSVTYFPISDYDEYMGTFQITIPHIINTVEMQSGNVVEIVIDDVNGRGYLTVEFIDFSINTSGLATAVALETAETNILAIRSNTDLLTLDAINAEIDSALIEHDVPTTSDLITLNTVVTLPSGRTKTFEQIIEDIYKYRKW